MCVVLVNDTLNAVWGDTRNGKLDIWFQRMSIQNGVLNSVINLSENNNRKLIKIVDELGRETKGIRNIPLFYIYDDGTVEKKIILE
jgi:hypothetical protein